jgi:signal transduction histidine kinase
MAAAHGGRLEITSAKGEGFHATLVLPVAVDDPTLPPPREGV